MYVIGTAGHVDHGKSTLVQALTGIDPDRLREEKEREMTIDLGFAWLRLGEAGEEVGVVDVPGHRDFIENMLAGIGGIDVGLLVVAADEGVMPQSVEHLAILDLLEVQGGVVALTKVDLIDDPEWLELVTLEVSEALAGTVLAEAPIIPVSARSGRGMEALKARLWEQLERVGGRPDLGRPRLPIDRVFSVAGFGTVVTGTLAGGRLQEGDSVEVGPAGLKGRIRGLQTHKSKVAVARPGSRVAINLTGIDRDEVKRGDVVALRGGAGSTILFDAAYRHLPAAVVPLKHNMEVKLFVGAAEVVARTRVLGARQIEPGEEGWLQVATAEPVAITRGDRFILRRPSPGTTLGGGRVLDANPGRRHRRFRPAVVQRLATLAEGTPAELLMQNITRLEPVRRVDLLRQSSLDEATATAALRQLEDEEQVIALDQYFLSRSRWQRIVERLAAIVAEYHRDFPLRPGILREELRSRLQLQTPVFNPLLSRAAAEGVLVESATVVHAPGHRVRLSSDQQKVAGELLGRFAGAGANSPSIKEAKAAVGEEVYFALVDLGQLWPVSEDVVYAAADYEQLTGRIKAYLQENGRINAAQVRDLLGTSRKYAIALLEHLDELRITRRIGDERELI